MLDRVQNSFLDTDDNTLEVVTVEGVQAKVGGVGGSSPEDFILTFNEQAGANDPVTYPVAAVDTDAQTFAIEGNHVPFNRGLIRISGSSANDGIYSIVSCAFDSDAGQTVFTSDDTIGDPTVDGTVELPASYTASVDLPSNSAFEWWSAKVLTAWDCVVQATSLKSGTADDDAAFGFSDTDGIDVTNIDSGRYVWGVEFLGDSNEIMRPPNSPPNNYPVFPDGETLIFVLYVFDDASSVGVLQVVVHWHATQDGPAPIRSPIGS